MFLLYLHAMTIQEKINLFAPVAELMPGVVIIHELKGFKPVYMSSKGLKLLGMTMEELIAMGEDYKRVVLNDEFMEDFLKSFEKMLQKEKEWNTYSIFHQVKLPDDENYGWHISSVKAFNKDSENNTTHTVTIGFPLGQFLHIPQKAEKILHESLFSKKHLKQFLTLSPRAIEVLKLVALGNSTAEIAEELKISPNTVNSHRKLIKQKLNISTFYDFTKYARSYDLI